MPAYLLTGGNLFDATGSTSRQNPGVLVEDGRIVQIGGATESAAEAIDLSGMTLLPGLVNAHMHLAMYGFGEDYYGVYRAPGPLQLLRSVRSGLIMLSQGVTTVRDAGSFEAIVLWLRRGIELGLLRGPRIVTCGNPISPKHVGQDVHETGMTVDALDGEELLAQAERLLDAGADFVKIKTDRRDFAPGGKPRYFTVDEMRPTVEAAHRRGKPVTAHANEPFIISDSLEAGVDVIEHGQWLGQDPALLLDLAARGTFLVPCANSWSTSAAATEERRDSQRTAIREALLGGVKLAVGTDLYSDDMIQELRWLVAAGASPATALIAATRTGAELCGLGSEVGTVEAGKWADLVAVAGDPTEDIAALRETRLVVSRGVPLRPAELLGAVGPQAKILG